MASSSPCCWTDGRECVEWVEKYFEDCVCDLRSEISFSLGILSLLFWGIAEIPQIISNYRTKSGHGVSIALLLTWFIGDIFNLVGCRLEPATLPTQFYTALLYTAVTVVLLLQTFYYDYYGRYWKDGATNGRFKNVLAVADHDDGQHLEAKKQPLIHRPSMPNEAAKPLPAAINTSNRASPRSDYYYTSARSLASSGTPSYLSYLGRVGSGPSMAAAATLHDSSSSDDDEAQDNAHDSQQVLTMSSAKPKPILSPNGGYAAFIIGSAAALPSRASALLEAHAVFLPRRLLKDTGLIALEANPYGIALGWIMAAIYMGGRVPQIYLNIKRGGVEGLNPLMFTFAIIANATYVGSILVRSFEWQRIKANAPWLLDAIVCVLLDLFIILQFAYYNFLHNGTTACNVDEVDVNEASTEGRKTFA